jgi:hypothetical protein
MKYLEILTIKLTIWFLKRGVGKPCSEPDIDTEILGINNPRTCLTCRAWKVIRFLEEYITL